MGDPMYEQPMGYATKGTAGGPGQVSRELERQEVALSELHNEVSLLEERLRPVRLSGPERAGPDSARPEAIRVDVAQSIASRTYAVEEATRRIRVVLGELEL
jgi:hypothetical protein